MAENVIENTAGGITNGIRNGMNTMGNTISPHIVFTSWIYSTWMFWVM